MGLQVQAERISDEQFKKYVVHHNVLKLERDQLLAGVELPENIAANPMAMMGILPKLNDFKRAFELSKSMEEISSVLMHEQILRIAENG